MARNKLTVYLSAFHSRRLASVCPMGMTKKAHFREGLFQCKLFKLSVITGGYGRMRQTKGAIGNLLNRYKAVLRKCALLNIFGSLALAGALCAGTVTDVYAEIVVLPEGEYTFTENREEQQFVIDKDSSTIIDLNGQTISFAVGNAISIEGKLVINDSAGNGKVQSLLNGSASGKEVGIFIGSKQENSNPSLILNS